MNQGYCIFEVIFNNSGRPDDYRFLEINPAFIRLTGLKNVTGKTLRGMIPYLKEEWYQNFGDVITTGNSYRFEDSVAYMSQVFWYSVNAFRIDKPEEHHLAILFNNITGKKKAQEYYRIKLEEEVRQRTAELVESRDFIRHVTDTSPDVLYIINLAENRISYISKGVTSFGYSPETIYSMGTRVFKELVHPDDFPLRLANIADFTSLKPDEVRESEFRLKDASGKWRWVYNRSTLFKTNEYGIPTEVLGITQDITNKKQAELAYQEEKNRNAELKRINEVMDTFIYAAAHDLKAPISNLIMLTSAIGHSDNIELKLDLQKKYRPIVETLNKTIAGMIDVLSVEKVSVCGAKSISLNNVFEQVVKELQEKINAVKPEIRTDFSMCPDVIYMETYLLSIFRNMLSNALKYRSEDRKLVVDVISGKEGGLCTIEFSDNGIGIDLGTYGEDMFKPFRRFCKIPEGTGIGLHLVRNIVTKNGGKIEVRSEVGKGTTFIIYLVEYKHESE